MKPVFLVTAPVGTRSGYGSHSRDICRSLIDMDKFDIKIWPVRWGNTPQNALNEKEKTTYSCRKFSSCFNINNTIILLVNFNIFVVLFNIA